MGASPSQNLYDAGVRGDVSAGTTALAAGAKIDYRNEKGQTALFAAAKRDRVQFVLWALRNGAQSYANASGMTALHAAAAHGAAASAAVLLARGMDHFSRDSAGLRPIDAAALRGHVGVVRLIEARTCPFLSELDLEVPSLLPLLFSASFEPRWAAVHRARPLDNRHVDPREASLAIYASRGAALPELELLQPVIAPVRTDEEGLVVFDLTCVRMLRAGHSVFPPRKVTARLPRPVYAWLRRVLSDHFGERPARSGEVFSRDVPIVPLVASAYIGGVLAGFDWSLAPGGALGHLAVEGSERGAAARAEEEALQQRRQQQLQQQPQQPQQRLQMPPQPQQQHQQQHQQQEHAAQGLLLVGGPPVFQQLPQPRAAPAAAVAAAPPAPMVPSPVRAQPVNHAVLALQRELDEGVLEFFEQVPDEYTCVITSEIMLDPVVAADGHSYSRSGISEWIKRKATSPKTNEALESLALLTNHHLRGQIFEWIEQHRIRAGEPPVVAAAAAAAAPAAAPRAVASAPAAAAPAYAAAPANYPPALAVQGALPNAVGHAAVAGPAVEAGAEAAAAAAAAAEAEAEDPQPRALAAFPPEAASALRADAAAGAAPAAAAAAAAAPVLALRGAPPVAVGRAAVVGPAIEADAGAVAEAEDPDPRALAAFVPRAAAEAPRPAAVPAPAPAPAPAPLPPPPWVEVPAGHLDVAGAREMAREAAERAAQAREARWASEAREAVAL